MATAASMAAVLAIYALWQVFRESSPHPTLVGDLFFFPVSGAAVISGLAASRRCKSVPRLKAAWLLLAGGAAAYLAGDVLQTFYELAGHKPYPSVADGLYLCFYPMMLLGLLRFASRPPSRVQRRRLTLDVAVVAIGGAAVVIEVVLGPTLLQSGPNILQTVFSIAYPVGDMVLLVGLGSVLLRGAHPSSQRALRLIAAGLILYVIADLIYGYLTLHSTYSGGDPVDGLWMTAIALFAVAGGMQSWPDSETDHPVPVWQVRAVSWLPHAAVAICFGLLLYDVRRDPLLPDATLVVAAAVMAALVSLRQFLTQRDLLHTQGRLAYQSLHDSLTDLPNRLLVMDRAEQMLARARRAHNPVAILYIDIDGFKQINDSFGHEAGDALLRGVADRLSRTVRQADTIGRLGGDEFVVLLENFALDRGPDVVAQRICRELARPIELPGDHQHAAKVTASVGIATGLRGSAEALVRDADMALYEAKSLGKNRWVAFRDGMHTLAQSRLQLEMDLKDAIGSDQLFLLYQPIFELSTQTVTGVEALVRWRHPEEGVLGPGAFIPLAEETGLIVDLGEWVLRTACRQAARWHREGHRLGVAVNLAGPQLDSPDLVKQVTGAQRAADLEPGALTLEITETTLMRDADGAAARLKALRDTGVRVAIDDFGTGYSSMSYLRRFPVDALKIDRSFISGTAESGQSGAIIHTLVQLGKTLGLETVGEGIETPAQLQRLQREHCDSGQGFLLARPLEPAGVTALLDVSSRSPSIALSPSERDLSLPAPAYG